MENYGSVQNDSVHLNLVNPLNSFWYQTWIQKHHMEYKIQICWISKVFCSVCGFIHQTRHSKRYKSMCMGKTYMAAAAEDILSGGSNFDLYLCIQIESISSNHVLRRANANYHKFRVAFRSTNGLRNFVLVFVRIMKWKEKKKKCS